MGSLHRRHRFTALVLSVTLCAATAGIAHAANKWAGSLPSHPKLTAGNTDFMFPRLSKLVPLSNPPAPSVPHLTGPAGVEIESGGTLTVSSETGSINTATITTASATTGTIIVNGGLNFSAGGFGTLIGFEAGNLTPPLTLNTGIPINVDPVTGGVLTLGASATFNPIASDPTTGNTILIDPTQLQQLLNSGALTLNGGTLTLGSSTSNSTLTLGSSNSSFTSGNVDGASTIDLTDLNDILSHLSINSSDSSLLVSPQSLVSSSTPEPTSLALLALAAPLLLKRRR